MKKKELPQFLVDRDPESDAMAICCRAIRGLRRRVRYNVNAEVAADRIAEYLSARFGSGKVKKVQ